MTKDSRIVFFKELAKAVDPTGTIAHVPGTFLTELKKYLNFSDNEIACLFGVSRPAIVRKRNAAETEVVAALTTDGSKEVTLDDFMNLDSPEGELEFLKTYGRKMLKTLPETSPVRMTLYKLLVENSEKRLAGEVEEGRELITALLTELKEVCLESRDKVKDEFKALIRKSLAQFFEALDANPDKDPIAIRDSFLMQVEAFDACNCMREIFLSKPTLKKKLDEYTAKREDIPTKAPSLVGAGVVKKGLVKGEEASRPGGAQYKQAKRRKERERE